MTAPKKTTTPRKKTGRPPGRTQDTPLHLRIDAELLARLDALTERVAKLGIARSGVVRALIAVGLAAAEADVRVLLGPDAPATKTTKKGKA